MSDNENKKSDLEPLKERESTSGNLAKFVIGAVLLIAAIGVTVGFFLNKKPSEVTPTPTVAPTEEVLPTVVPTPTDVLATPTPVPTVTVEPTTTPIPTPTMAVSEDATFLDSVKMGDDVWYDFYDDGTLVVRGTGKTRDFADAIQMHTYVKEQCSLEQKAIFFSATTIILEEGITEIGECALGNFVDATKVIFPSTLECLNEYALYAMGYNSGIMEYVGLDVNKVKTANSAFAYCGSPEKIPNSEKYTATPTPTPAPTATPLPDPNKPRKYATKQMGDNVTFEFWDNGYLYVKGTGATWDKNYVTFLDFRNEPYCNTHTVIIEDGITYLGTSVFNELNKVSYYSLPITLTTISSNTGGYNVDEITIIEGFYDGKAVTLKIKGTGNPGQFHSIIENAKLYKEYYPGMFEVIFE